MEFIMLVQDDSHEFERLLKEICQLLIEMDQDSPTMKEILSSFDDKVNSFHIEGLKGEFSIISQKFLKFLTQSS